MVKFERKDTEKARKAQESLKKEKACHGTYNTEEVNMALNEMFHGKCYICESKQVTSYQIEHLIPHREDEDLKFDWNNLFLSCAHCNNTKLGKFDNILDCSLENVDEKIAFRKKGYFGINEELEFEALDESPETLNTIKLLKTVYYGTTPQKKMESKMLRRDLRKNLSDFKEYVREYQEAEGEDKEDLRCKLMWELSEKSPYTAFKRWLIRDNQERFSELLQQNEYSGLDVHAVR